MAEHNPNQAELERSQLLEQNFKTATAFLELLTKLKEQGLNDTAIYLADSYTISSEAFKMPFGYTSQDGYENPSLHTLIRAIAADFPRE